MKRRLTTAHVCLDCRKTFKKYQSDRAGEPFPCPQCRRAMRPVGNAFHAPRKRDDKGWEQVRKLLAAGYRFEEGEVLPSSQYLRKPERPRGKPKGVVSLFQLPGRKRNRRSQQADLGESERSRS